MLVSIAYPSATNRTAVTDSGTFLVLHAPCLSQMLRYSQTKKTKREVTNGSKQETTAETQKHILLFVIGRGARRSNAYRKQDHRS